MTRTRHASLTLSCSPQGEDSLNVLLVGNMDCRHVLKTLSCLHRHAATLAVDAEEQQGAKTDGGGKARRRKVRFFVAETVMELVARQLLFILAALEPPDRLGRTEKVRSRPAWRSSWSLPSS